MRSSSTPQYSVSFSLMVAALVALAVVGSVWGKGSGQQAAERPSIDVDDLTSKANTTNLPVLTVEQPF